MMAHVDYCDAVERLAQATRAAGALLTMSVSVEDDGTPCGYGYLCSLVAGECMDAADALAVASRSLDVAGCAPLRMVEGGGVNV